MTAAMSQTDSLTIRLLGAYESLRNLGLVKNKREFADIAGFMQQYWTGFEKGTRKVSPIMVTNVAKHFGLSLTYLLTGEGQLFETPSKKIAESLNGAEVHEEVNALGMLSDMPHVDLPFPDFKALAHFGQHPGLSLRSFISSPTLRVYLEPGELPEKYDGAMVVEVWGDSMEPYLYSGDRVVIWQVPESKWESLYNVDCVVAYDDTVTIKAIAENDLYEHNRLKLRAANPSNSYFVVAREAINSIWEVRELYKRPRYIPSSQRR